MATSWWNRFQMKKSRKLPRRDRFVPRFEVLGDRIAPAVTASFDAGTGVLSVFGDSLNNTIAVSRDAAGQILVNGGAVAIQGGAATVANTALIEVFGQSGNDNISLNETNGALPAAFLFGGSGNDILTGGSGADQLFGQSGNDTLLGKGGNDQLFGGSDNDVLTGGTGDDRVFGESGNDRMIWNPGEGSDLNEGGDGIDTVEVNGGNGAEVFSATANGTRVRFDRLDPAPFFLDIGSSENLVLNANGGNDTFTGGNGLAPLISLTIDGGAGNDSITGGDGADVLLGGDGDDAINGGRGSDSAFLGAGDDSFTWNPGDGSDVVEGQAGTDAMIFNGSNANENIDISANGARIRFFRDVASITMDLNQVERVDFNALGGADAITVNNLAGTAVKQVNLNLSASGGGGDAQADTVIVVGTNAKDLIAVTGTGTDYAVAGLPANISVTGSEGANDSLVINSLGGNDTVNATGLSAATVRLTIDGGDGNDSITGGDGNDVLLGGDGNDSINGGRGDDVAFLGAGDDNFTWNPGDGSDVLEGQAGTDLMLFNGSNANENIDISANGQRVRFFRDVANITMDLDGVEKIDFRAFGGADNISVNDLTGTSATDVFLGLAAASGVEGQADNVFVNGTNGDDVIKVAGGVGNVNVSGLAAKVKITGAEAALDRLTINALGGVDVVDASGLAAGAIGLTLDGGAGADVLTGSQGADLIIGRQGDDVANMGSGNDTFVWNPGDGSDTVDGQGGADILLFNGSNANENIDISANGKHARFFRDVANITMDLNLVERIDFNAIGGADNITVNDLTGTGVTQVNLNLAATGGGGDGQADNVVVNGTNGDDLIRVAGDANGVSVLGLTAQVNVTNAEPANDGLVVNGLAGDDVINASKLAANTIKFTADGGAGDDVLIGSAGIDTLLGGAGDDFLSGGPGLDILDGGPGDNVLIQD